MRNFLQVTLIHRQSWVQNETPLLIVLGKELWIFLCKY